MNELLEEISQKITLLNEEQNRIDGERESRVSMIITVFGLVSIISATLQMLDYISTGRPLMIIGFLATSVFIMTFKALTGAISHFSIGGSPDYFVMALCILFTFIWARIAAKFANKATPKTLNRLTGIVLVALGVVVMGFNLL